MKKKKRIVFMLFVLIVAAVAVVVFRNGDSEKNKPEVRTAVAGRGDVVASVSGNGVLQPVTTVEVKSNVGGQVTELAVDEGDYVKAGQLIAKIDTSDSVAALEQAQANYEGAVAKLRQAQEQSKAQPGLTANSISQAESSLAAAKASYEQMKNATVPQKLSSAKSAYDQASAAFDKAEKDMERQRALLEKGFVSKSDVESAEKEYAVAKAQLESARRTRDTVQGDVAQELKASEAKVSEAGAGLETAKKNSYQISVKQDDVVQAKASLSSAKASLDNARTQLGYTTIYAPRDGVIVAKYVDPGSIVTAGKSSFAGSGSGVALVDIADVSRMQINVDVDETDIAQIRIGQEVNVTVDAYPEEKFTGKVTKIAPQAQVESSVTTIPVTVEVENPDPRLKPVMNATCEFLVASRRGVIVVPNQAVKSGRDGSNVMVVENGQQMIRPVEVGISDNDNTEIISGLKEGDVVVTSASGAAVKNNGSDRGGPPPPF